jgi:DNA-binding response OmpR family regulator
MFKKVMIIDDDREFLEELNDILHLSGYDTYPTNDALQACVSASDYKPDIIIMDFRMPGKTGFDVARDLRAMPDFKATPIIGMTAFVGEDYEDRMRQCAISTYLRKPFNPLEIISVIEKVS